MTDSVELTLFFAFNAINLPWVALRYFSIAIDEYVFHSRRSRRHVAA